MNKLGYSALMDRGAIQITLRIDTKDPIEIGDFVSSFTSLASQYEKFMRENHPDLAAEGEVYVKEVRAGSIIADLLPHLSLAVPFIDGMEKVLIVEQFVRTYGARISKFFIGGGRDKGATKSDLKDFAGTVSAIARDPDANAQLDAAYFEDGRREVKASFKFSTPQARIAVEQIQAQKLEIEHQSQAEYSKVLMRFTRPDINPVSVNKRSGERVVIENVSPKHLALIYASENAENSIKQILRDAEDNVFRLGFIVDVNVQLSEGRPVAYRVTNYHQTIEIPDSEDD